jgi:CRISPR-associated endonuclease/helicase Cas3
MMTTPHNNRQFYAHSIEGKSPVHWQPLEDHLNNVAHLAAEFARPFGGDQWAYLAGLWHDLGKYSNEFQAMLLRENGIEAHIETAPGRVVHSEAGGHHATLKGWQGADRLISWLVMGHHAGLADYQSDENGARALSVRMRNPERSETLLQNVPAHLLNQEPPRQAPPKEASIAFYIRMLFSCLVDADFLDTEAFMNAANARLRGKYPTLRVLRSILFDGLYVKMSDGDFGCYGGV